MRNKYYKKINEALVPWKYDSHVLIKMIEIRELIKHQIWWQIISGNVFFWYDNWTGLGTRYHASGPDHWYDAKITQVYDLMEDGK